MDEDIDFKIEVDDDNDIVEMLEAKLVEPEEYTRDEKKIIDGVLETLREHELRYSYDPDFPRNVELWSGVDNKPFRMNISLQNGKLIYRLSFPFRVQSNAIPLVAMYMAKYNSEVAFSHIDLDQNDGEIAMEYAYIIEDPARFDKKEFWVYLMLLVLPSLDEYTKLSHLSMGVVPRKDRGLYKILLEKALKTLDDEYEDEDVTYGTEELERDKMAERIIRDAMRKKRDTGSVTETTKSDCETEIGVLPSFEEFMRMKASQQKDDDESPADGHTKDVMSMFENSSKE